MIASKGSVSPSLLNPSASAIHLLASPIIQGWTSLKAARAARAALRESIEALSKLDDAALDDIGVRRREIPAVAQEAVRASR